MPRLANDALLLANFTRKSLFSGYVSRDEVPPVSSHRDERTDRCVNAEHDLRHGLYNGAQFKRIQKLYIFVRVDRYFNLF